MLAVFLAAGTVLMLAVCLAASAVLMLAVCLAASAVLMLAVCLDCSPGCFEQPLVDLEIQKRLFHMFAAVISGSQVFFTVLRDEIHFSIH